MLLAAVCDLRSKVFIIKFWKYQCNRLHEMSQVEEIVLKRTTGRSSQETVHFYKSPSVNDDRLMTDDHLLYKFKLDT